VSATHCGGGLVSEISFYDTGVSDANSVASTAITPDFIVLTERLYSRGLLPPLECIQRVIGGGEFGSIVLTSVVSKEGIDAPTVILLPAAWKKSRFRTVRLPRCHCVGPIKYNRE
jgi:hypothetical protein